MSTYSERLRREKRSELASRVVTFATKTEDGVQFPAGDYAYVPDADMPSTWKLRLTSTPGGTPDARIVGAAVAALGEGFRGNKVQIPEADLAAVKAKVKAAWKKANPEKDEADIPAIIACGEMEHGHDDDGLGWGPIDGADKTFLEALLPYHADLLNLISKTDFKDPKVAEYAAHLAKKLVVGSAEIRNRLSPPDEAVAMPALAEPEMKKYTYEVEMDDLEFAGLPDFMKAGIIKGLKKKLAAETDDKKKAEIQVKIDNLEGE